MRAIPGKLGESVGRSLANARWSGGLVAVMIALWLPIVLRGGPEQVGGWFVTLGLTRDGVIDGAVWSH